MDAVAHYLSEILTPALKAYGISDDFIQYTIETVGLQMTSLLRNWDDLGFRRTMLLLGSEEGTFYEPNAKLDTKCFVVVAIRNSPIETIQSENFQKAGLEHPIKDEDVKAITSKAIQFLNKQDFTALCKAAKSSAKPDVYRQASIRYPVAWTALWQLANTSRKQFDYEKVSFDAPYAFFTPAQTSNSTEKENSDVKKIDSVYDGFIDEMDPALAELLRNVVSSGSGLLVVDSIKAATRNFEKLLKILEYLLTHECAFVTSNFYLENGHVERRVKLLRAGHTVREMERNFAQQSGLGPRHKAALKSLTNQ